MGMGMRGGTMCLEDNVRFHSVSCLLAGLAGSLGARIISEARNVHVRVAPACMHPLPACECACQTSLSGVPVSLDNHG